MIRPTEPVNLPEGTEVEFRTVKNGDSRADPRTLNDRFWNPPSIEELAREQGVKPIKSLDDLGADWPDNDDDIDEFLRSIREGRR